jgi:hypothetical protein
MRWTKILCVYFFNHILYRSVFNYIKLHIQITRENDFKFKLTRNMTSLIRVKFYELH